MYNMKFISGDSYVCIQCPHYHVSTLASGIVEVTLFKDFTSQDGVTYRVGIDKSEVSGIVHFNTCYVMNNQGKTIDRIAQ